MDVEHMRRTASAIRQGVIELSHSAGTPHLGSSLSCIDILTSLYWSVMSIDPQQPNQPERDRFILSKGHAALALYVTLAERGFFSKEVLQTYNTDGGRLAEHPGPGCVSGIEAATGSLGHGLPLGIGMAMAARLKKSPTRVFVLLGDGECNEGSVWEAAMMAPAQNLSHLAIIVDYNKWQATARSNETLSLAPLAAKWQAFGWETHEVDGHDVGEITRILKQVPTNSGKPLAVIAHTIKGRGVSFMEDDNNWHYRIPSADEVRQAAKELQIA
ncbi:MAG: transketolase [Gemmataceae bacterium]|nr:transketolase [Gemmataceae bacterium]